MDQRNDEPQREKPKAEEPTEKPIRKRHYPKFPIRVGQARIKLAQAVITGDHGLASWIDRAAMSDNITGAKEEIIKLLRELDEVMEDL